MWTPCPFMYIHLFHSICVKNNCIARKNKCSFKYFEWCYTVYLCLQLDGNLEGWKIGLLTEGFSGCDSDVQSVVHSAARALSKAGAMVEDVSIPLHSHGQYDTLH